MNLELPLSKLLEAIEDPFEVTGGSTEQIVTGFANLKDAISGDLSFLQSKKFANDASATSASVLLVPSSLDGVEFPSHSTLVRVENPSRALTQICGRVEAILFRRPEAVLHEMALVNREARIHDDVALGAFTTVGENAVIESGCRIGSRVSIGANCQIGRNVEISDNCVIGDYTTIGDHSRILSGAVIGAPGFGYDFNPSAGCHDPIPQIGRVVIGSYVDVGANSTIDRARIGETRIGDGTKIDNLVQVAHNVKIGSHCILCAYVGISGSVTIGDYVVLAGKVGVADHVTIASGVQVGGGSAVTGNLDKPKMKAWGAPATDFGAAMKLVALQRKLPDLFKRVGAIEKQIGL